MAFTYSGKAPPPKGGGALPLEKPGEIPSSLLSALFCCPEQLQIELLN